MAIAEKGEWPKITPQRPRFQTIFQVRRLQRLERRWSEADLRGDAPKKSWRASRTVFAGAKFLGRPRNTRREFRSRPVSLLHRSSHQDCHDGGHPQARGLAA